jgi:hypothetical protein
MAGVSGCTVVFLLTISGPVLAKNDVLERVNAAAPAVRPWYPPCMTIMLFLPVLARETLIAASIASLPEFQKKKLSKVGLGIMGSNDSTSWT